jgi:hypothetical protein
LAKERVITRHIRGGLSPEEAAVKYEMNDRRNADIVRRTIPDAHFVIVLDELVTARRAVPPGVWFAEQGS